MWRPYHSMVLNNIDSRIPNRRLMSNCAENEPYALRVLGNSMEPEFRDGQIIVVEPAMELVDGSFVVAHIDDEYILRKLTKDNSQWRLEPLNKSYPTMAVADVSTIRGRVVQRAGRRRSERKGYL